MKKLLLILFFTACAETPVVEPVPTPIEPSAEYTLWDDFFNFLDRD